MSFRIIIVEDNHVVRGCLEELIHTMSGCECVGSFITAEEALKLAVHLKPDLAMMDIHLPNLSGIECTARLREMLPDLRVLMLTMYEDDDKIFEAFKAGASGYLLKRSSPLEIQGAIEEVLRGGAPMTSAIALKVVESFRRTPKKNPGDPELSRREKEILQCLAKGSANKEIADELGISPDTVHSHLKQIYHKLHVKGRTAAALKFQGMQE
ncbi:response regulator transcription factor [Luteolibacter ambystomatis]|uniref:Response regulator transcription factor n=1 Tax=Luteolibacter ambystomatis TaxID=2824561 RepID=A0A975J362_9BACT|nr:response regulator transcription factor [Luteolibacter ambystomatis]QUE53174.1 response regulator transcription factor [Luteolibacter ambystomatis]